MDNIFIRETKQKFLQFETIFLNLYKSFNESKHKSLNYYANERLSEGLAVYICSEICKTENPTHYFPTIEKIIFNHDFRLIGDYLRAILNNNNNLKSHIENLTNDNQDYQTINYQRFKSIYELDKKRKIIEIVDSIEEIFTPKDGDYVGIFFPTTSKESAKSEILELADKTNGLLAEYIDTLLDLEGHNSLVRKGLVKKIQLSSHKSAITKKNNPDKEGRFQNELINIQKLLRVLELKSDDDKIFFSNPNKNEKSVVLKMLQPYAVFIDHASRNYYSITKHQEGSTLEEVLYLTRNQKERQRHFLNVRTILEYLYKKGVIWGDMAPRNIIVNEIEEATEYIILDFEKTRIVEAPVSIEDRLEHARGPMCVEEFGSICSQEEVEAIFKGYFEPAKWDVATTSLTPFAKPKRELADILIGRGNVDYSFGDYNQLELEVMKVRFPYQGKDKLQHPLYISFKVDHYLGTEFDRKTTELFTKARQHNLLSETITILEKVLTTAENEFIISDLKTSASAKIFLFNRVNNPSIILLKNLINKLYGAVNKEEWLELIQSSHKEISFIVNNLNSHPKRSLVHRNYGVVKDRVKMILEKALNLFSPDLLLVSGSFARKELTYGSDLEIFIIGDSYREVESFLQTQFSKTLKMDIDMYAVTDISEIEKFLTEFPDYFIDFQNVEVGADKDNFGEIFTSSVNKVLRKSGFIFDVFKKRSVEHLNSYTYQHGSREHIKEILNLWSFLEVLQKTLGIQTSLSDSNHIKSSLLHYKSQIEFQKFYGMSVGTDISQEFLTNSILLLENTYREIRSYLESAGYKEDSSYKFEFGLEEIQDFNKLFFENQAAFSHFNRFESEFDETQVKELLTPTITSQSAPTISSARGATIQTTKGKNIIDMSSMTVNCILGQNDFWVSLNQVSYILSNQPSYHSTKFGSRIYYEVPKLLADIKIGGIENPLINHRQCNGSDVVEIAIKSAFEKRKGRKHIISFVGSYHGQNLTSYIISDIQKKHQFLSVNNDDVIFLPSPPNHKAWAVPESLEERALIKEEEEIINKLISVAENAYAIILEPVQCNNGLLMFSLPLMRKIREIATKYDICLILDEIQTGFGWLGKMTASELYGIAPDILLLGKALTAGYGALAIAVFSQAYGASLPYGTSEKTNGADVRSLVAVKAVYERLNGVSELDGISHLLDDKFRAEMEEGLLKKHSKKIKLLEAYIHNLLCDHKDVALQKRGMGLIRGIKVNSIGDLSAADVAEKIVKIGLDRGILLRRTNDVLIIKPPIVITETELSIGFQRLSKVLSEVSQT